MGGFNSGFTPLTATTSAPATFSEPNWKFGDTVALADEVYRVRDVVYLNDRVRGIRGMLTLEQPARDDTPA